ncbi:unnamed protein product [Ceratitis capitata]|uniref:(Mediterranean fruit fly) hypothetical protein n=1 Tax=Ceratitis capitata TaxID=7213 RepID=A0A811U0P2_CERCA|nr:unnamed protein product [Ceratitis capitata]
MANWLKIFIFPFISFLLITIQYKNATVTPKLAVMKSYLYNCDFSVSKQKLKKRRLSNYSALHFIFIALLVFLCFRDITINSPESFALPPNHSRILVYHIANAMG